MTTMNLSIVSQHSSSLYFANLLGLGRKTLGLGKKYQYLLHLGVVLKLYVYYVVIVVESNSIEDAPKGP